MEYESGNIYRFLINEIKKNQNGGYTAAAQNVKNKKDKRTIAISKEDAARIGEELKSKITALKHNEINFQYIIVDDKGKKGKFIPAADLFTPEKVFAGIPVPDAGNPESDGVSEAAAAAVTETAEPETPADNAGPVPEARPAPKSAADKVEPASAAVNAAAEPDNCGSTVAPADAAAAAPQWEPGKKYPLNVWYTGNKKYITITYGDEANRKFAEIYYNGELRQSLNNRRTVNCICKEIGADGRPVFELALEYYANAVVVDRPEGIDCEFKQSIIYSPETCQPSSGQLRQIAKEAAAFMNTNGGKLYLGVDNDGRVSGIEKDFPDLILFLNQP